MKKIIIVGLIIIMVVIICSCRSNNTIEWALDQDYSFSVKQDATYEFTSYVFDKNKIPAIYDVHVNSEFVGTVGGSADDSVTKELHAGDQVYVKFNPVLGEKGNRLEIIKR